MLSNKVEVAIRIRPLANYEVQQGSFYGISIDETGKKIQINEETKIQTFNFDHVANEFVSQEAFFEKIVKPLADSWIEGKNATFFAYGQTGTGKTHTVLGYSFNKRNEMIALPKDENRGILPRCLEYIFASIDMNLFTITCSYYQIYQNKAYDLLVRNGGPLKISGQIKNGFYLSELSHNTISTIEEANR